MVLYDLQFSIIEVRDIVAGSVGFTESVQVALAYFREMLFEESGEILCSGGLRLAEIDNAKRNFGRSRRVFRREGMQ